jgi:hypothetical protein
VGRPGPIQRRAPKAIVLGSHGGGEFRPGLLSRGILPIGQQFRSKLRGPKWLNIVPDPG